MRVRKQKKTREITLDLPIANEMNNIPNPPTILATLSTKSTTTPPISSSHVF